MKRPHEETASQGDAEADVQKEEVAEVAEGPPPPSEEDWECSICNELLFEPVW